MLISSDPLLIGDFFRPSLCHVLVFRGCENFEAPDNSRVNKSSGTRAIHGIPRCPTLAPCVFRWDESTSRDLVCLGYLESVKLYIYYVTINMEGQKLRSFPRLCTAVLVHYASSLPAPLLSAPFFLILSFSFLPCQQLVGTRALFLFRLFLLFLLIF